MNSNVIANHPGFLAFSKSNIKSEVKTPEITEKEKEEIKEELSEEKQILKFSEEKGVKGRVITLCLNLYETNAAYQKE